MNMMHHNRPRVIADPEIHPREHTVAELLAESEQLLELLADGDYARLSDSTIRRATTVTNVQPNARYTSVGAALHLLAETDNIADAIEDLLSSPQTTTAVRKLTAGILLAADQLAEGRSR